MKKRHVKFIWGAAEVIRGHWYLGVLGFYDRVEGKHDDGLAISVRGLLRWSFGGAVAAYLALATAMFFIWERNPYSILTYEDALFRPVRREEVRDKQGQAFIAQGTDALRAKRWAEGVALLRQGLAYHPVDLRARLTLAQFYVMASQRLVALKVLQDGLAEEFPGRAFLQVLFDVAEQGEDFDLVVRTCDRYLPLLTDDASSRDRRWLVSRQFAALLASKHFTEARALANAEEPGEMASEHRVLAWLSAGRPDEALAAIAEWQARPGADQRAVLRLRARAQREAKRFDEMNRALDELKAMSPADARPYVYSVVQRAMAGREEAGAALEDFLFRFGGNPQNLQLVAEPLAEIGNRPLLERCAAAAAERGYPAQGFQVLQVQVYVQLGDWAAARRTLGAMKPVVGRTAGQAQVWRDWMQRVIDATTAPGDAAGTALVDFLRSRPWPVKIFQKTLEALRVAGRWETARDVVAVASGAFPASVSIETQKTEIARALVAQQAAHAGPVAALPGVLPSEKIYFQRLGELLLDEQWALAEQFIREARTAKPPPAWLEKRDGEIRLALMKISDGRGETAGLIAAAKLYLNGDNDRSQHVLDFGRAALARGDRETALTLGREVIRRTPDYAPAQRLLSEWQLRPAKK